MTRAAWYCPACQKHHAPHIDTCPGASINLSPTTLRGNWIGCCGKTPCDRSGGCPKHGIAYTAMTTLVGNPQ